jgi:hypothetical protein
VYAYTFYGFNYDLTIESVLVCKFYQFCNFALDALGAWCLVYISVEKFVNIAFHSKRFIFKRTKNQIIFLILLCLCTIIYNINVLFSVDILVFSDDDNNNNSSSSSSSFCFTIDNEQALILVYMDLVKLIILPFSLMIIFSILLIISIFKSRSRVNINDSIRERKRLFKDIKFSISLISMNLLFILLNLPIEILSFLAKDYLTFGYLYVAFGYIYYLASAINFYLIFLTNSLFRKEFLLLFKIKSKN